MIYGSRIKRTITETPQWGKHCAEICELTGIVLINGLKKIINFVVQATQASIERWLLYWILYMRILVSGFYFNS